MSKVLFLDDERTPRDDSWNVVRTYSDFVRTVKSTPYSEFSFVSFDHDLGEDPVLRKYKTGYDAVKFLVRYGKRTGQELPQVKVHSANPVGANNIVGYVNSYLKFVGKPQTAHRWNAPVKLTT